jgi:hypothetical protein
MNTDEHDTSAQHAVRFSHITITPIGKGSGAQTCRARSDYEEQRQRNVGHDENWCWDDGKHNTSQVGQLFAFRNNNDRMFTIHRIVSVKDPIHRLDTWSDNVGQSDRNVLELSHPLLSLPIASWVSLGGCSNGHMSTHCSAKGFGDDDLLYRQLICTL